MFWTKKKVGFRRIALQVLESKKLSAPRTYIQAKFYVARLIARFGELSIADFSEEDWTRYVLTENAKRKRNFFDDRKYMRIILNFAAREGVPVRKVKLPIPDLPSEAGREITRAERAKLLAAADSKLGFQIEIAWKMGLRRSEMLSLRWDQFDWERVTIRLEAADCLKTRRGREIPINADLIHRFRILRAESIRLAASLYVFPSPRNPQRPEKDNKTAWWRCKRKAGVKNARWHDLRHTCATELLRRGITTHVTHRYLGMSEKVLLRIYYHLNSADLRAASDTLAELRQIPHLP